MFKFRWETTAPTGLLPKTCRSALSRHGEGSRVPALRSNPSVERNLNVTGGTLIQIDLSRINMKLTTPVAAGKPVVNLDLSLTWTCR